jgi:hypothetical protein
MSFWNAVAEWGEENQVNTLSLTVNEIKPPCALLYFQEVFDFLLLSFSDLLLSSIVEKTGSRQSIDI